MNLKNLWTIWKDNNLTDERLDACAIEDNFGAKFSFGETRDQVVRFANALEALCPNQEMILYYGSTCTTLQFLRWATIKNGNAVNYINIDCHVEELVDEVRKQRIRTIFVVEAWLPNLLRVIDELTCDNLVVIRSDEFHDGQIKSHGYLSGVVSSIKILTVEEFLSLSSKCDEGEDYSPKRQDVAMIFRTNGTGGKSKAVKIGHEGCLNMYEKYLNTGDFGYSFGQSNLCFIFPAHVTETIHMEMMPSMCGCKLAIQADVRDGNILQWILRLKPTLVFATMIMYLALVKSGALRSGVSLSFIRGIYTGGEKVYQADADAINDAFHGAGVSKDVMLRNGYGLSETGAMALNNDYDLTSAVWLRPLYGVEAQIVTEAGEIIMEDGIPGVLLIHTEARMLGYLDDDILTEEAIVRMGGKLWVRTGDIAVRKGESFNVLGRDSARTSLDCGDEKRSVLVINDYLKADKRVLQAHCLVKERHVYAFIVPMDSNDIQSIIARVEERFANTEFSPITYVPMEKMPMKKGAQKLDSEALYASI